MSHFRLLNIVSLRQKVKFKKHVVYKLYRLNGNVTFRLGYP